ncbi:hypothetical protein AB0D35_23375 [Streptomyces sp. NPDC048301]
MTDFEPGREPLPRLLGEYGGGVPVTPRRDGWPHASHVGTTSTATISAR